MIMQKNHDLFLALMGRSTRGKLLGYFLAQGTRPRFIAQAAHAVQVDPAGAQRELRWLEAIGLLASTSTGYRKYYRLQDRSPLVTPLRQLYVAARHAKARPPARR